MKLKPSPEAFVSILRPAMEQAASIAVALEGRVVNVPKTDEPSPAKAALTVADTACQEALLVPLLERFSGATLEAEEDTPSVSHFTGRATDLRIVIDPIDGTLRFFLEAQGPYALMAGLAQGGRYEAALVALPRQSLFFHAIRGEGARVAGAGQPAAAAVPSGEGRRLLVSDGTPAAVARRLQDMGYETGLACGGALAVAPLIAGVRGSLRLANEGSISTRGRIGLLVTEEAGAMALTGEGTPFPADIDAPATALITASDERTAWDLRAALADA